MSKILWILAFLLLTFVGDRLGGLLLNSIVERSSFRYSRLYCDAAGADILLVGNSRGLSFFQPYIEEITKKSTFNTSYNSMPIDLARVIVDDYLDHYSNVEKVIIDVTLCDRSNPQLINGFMPYAKFSKRLDSLIHDNNPTAYYASKISHLYRYNNEIFQRAAFYQYKVNDEDWLIDRVITDALIEEVTQVDYRIDLVKLEELKKIIRRAKREGIAVTLIVNPYFPAFRDRMKGLDEFIQTVEEATQMVVHDYSKVITDPIHFGDYQHINKAGSRVYIDLLHQDNIF